MKKMAMFLGTAMLMTTILTGCGGTSEETDNGGKENQADTGRKESFRY